MSVEVNNRVNYPIKEILGQMLQRGDLSLDDDACKYCISWLTINVATVGVSLFVTSWNEHPIPGKYIMYSVLTYPPHSVSI